MRLLSIALALCNRFLDKPRVIVCMNHNYEDTLLVLGKSAVLLAALCKAPSSHISHACCLKRSRWLRRPLSRSERPLSHTTTQPSTRIGRIWQTCTRTSPCESVKNSKSNSVLGMQERIDSNEASDNIFRFSTLAQVHLGRRENAGCPKHHHKIDGTFVRIRCIT
jgi:hypothetical protein